jgi:hypothetical protein
MGMDAIVTLISLVLTKGPALVLELQTLFGGSAFTEEDLAKLAAGVRDPASYFKTPGF